MRQPSQGRRRGAVFSVRVTAEERAQLEALQRQGGPRGLGPWLVWRALGGEPPPRAINEVVPLRSAGAVLPPPAQRLILDLCAGSGAWSEPYLQAGYRVVRVTLPETDVRTYVPPAGVWGVLAAPPCTEFSRAKRGPRDEVAGLELVSACMRVVLQARPRWWALENPEGYLYRYLGPPRDRWEPYEFGDPWSKSTAVWGDYQIPRRGPFVVPEGSAMERPTAAARAITPPGFAQAFHAANP